MSKRSSHDDGAGAFAAVVLLGLLALVIVSAIWMPFLPWNEERQAGQETIDDTYDAESAQQQYEEFRVLYHDIQAQRAQVENAYEAERQFHQQYGNDTSEWSRSAETRHGRLHDRITGNQNELERLVAEYNAQSDMANKALFKCHLPYKVDERFAIRGPPGSGDADQPVDTGPDGEPINGSPPEAEQCDGLPDKIES